MFRCIAQNAYTPRHSRESGNPGTFELHSWIPGLGSKGPLAWNDTLGWTTSSFAKATADKRLE
jgi:hypothetical protein